MKREKGQPTDDVPTEEIVPEPGWVGGRFGGRTGRAAGCIGPREVLGPALMRPCVWARSALQGEAEKPPATGCACASATPCRLPPVFQVRGQDQ